MAGSWQIRKAAIKRLRRGIFPRHLGTGGRTFSLSLFSLCGFETHFAGMNKSNLLKRPSLFPRFVHPWISNSPSLLLYQSWEKKRRKETPFTRSVSLCPSLCLANRSHLIYVFPGRETRNSRILILVSVSRNKGSPMNLPPSLSAKFKIDPAGGVYFSPPSERPSRKLRPCRGFLPRNHPIEILPPPLVSFSLSLLSCSPLKKEKNCSRDVVIDFWIF